MSRIKRNIGFDGRVFLTQEEWLTYCRRKPVRYIRYPKTLVCQVCGNPPLNNNPLQSAHIIGFDLGIIELGLTPEFLDSDKNIMTAHRNTCNKKVEQNLSNSMIKLRQIQISELPSYLPTFTRELYRQLM
jgi:hypothetical protein